MKRKKPKIDGISLFGSFLLCMFRATHGSTRSRAMCIVTIVPLINAVSTLLKCSTQLQEIFVFLSENSIIVSEYLIKEFLRSITEKEFVCSFQ